MIVSEKILKSRAQTAAAIYAAAENWKDLGILVDTDLETFFNYVRDIPYREDRDSVEVVARPKYLLNNFRGLDCKKKSVLIGAWLNAHRINWHLVAVSERADGEIHHIFVRAFLGGRWRNIDPTYQNYELFEPKKITAGEVF